MSNRLGWLFIASACVIGTGTAAAHEFPSKPVRIVAPFPAGGALDTIARTLAQPLGRAFGQGVIIDNRPGGTGVIGANMVARAAADGHTLLMIGSVFTINAAVKPKLPYDTLKDFTGVARVASNPMLISVHPSLPVKTLADMVALARRRPGQLTYATSGPASPMHLAMETFRDIAKVELIHVPYQGGAHATMAALGGHASVLIVNVSEAVPHAVAGRLRPLAVTSLRRSEVLNGVPTVAESGFPGFDMSIWFGAWAPAATPRETVKRLGAEMVRASQLPEVQDALGKLGLSVTSLGPEEFDTFFRAEVRRYAKIVHDLKLRMD